jgi:uncharacterized protein
MKKVIYLLLGIVFGVALTKGEAISWYRIQEMFRFESFHMYGIFMTAVPVGALSIFMMTKLKIRTLNGELIRRPMKPYHHGMLLGGLVFGFGWALTGACPGPLYAQIGTGYLVTIITFLSALAGTWTYTRFANRLPS